MKSSEVLLTLRQNLISGFKKYEVILMPIIRFLINIGLLYMLKERTSYTGALSSVIVTIIIALVGAVVSAEWILIASIFLVPIYLIPSSLIIAAMAFAILASLYILYGRFFPKESLFIIATIVAFPINMELLVPIVAALFGNIASMVAIIIGLLLKFILPQLSANLTVVEKNQTTESLEKLLAMDFKALIADQTMLIMITVFLVVFMTIYLIKKLSIDYGPYIAIMIGAVMNIMGFGLAKIFFVDIEIDLIRIVIETILMSLIGVVIQFFSIALDYQRAENVNFEDDDNYYYVRIVPKIKLSFKQNKVKRVYTDEEHLHHDNRINLSGDHFNQEI